MIVRLFLVAVFSSLAYAATPEQRAVDYLTCEVPAWYDKNRCFSCHHDGDGARVLYTAGATKTLGETTKG